MLKTMSNSLGGEDLLLTLNQLLVAEEEFSVKQNLFRTDEDAN